MIRIRKGGAVLAAALALGLAAGCGGGDRLKTYTVTGKVTYKGKAVPNGTINFIPDGPGPSATGELQKDGTFTLKTYTAGDGAVAGKHKVVVVALADQKDALPEARSPTPPAIVPNKFTSPATSTLTADVQAKDNVIDFDLKD
jgi:hypothetical protein